MHLSHQQILNPMENIQKKSKSKLHGLYNCASSREQKSEDNDELIALNHKSFSLS